MGIWQKVTDIAAGAASFFVEHEHEQKPGKRVDDAGFATALIALGAKLAKADGLVTAEEVSAFREVFSAPKSAQNDVARLFNLFRQTTLGYESYAKRIARKFRCCPCILEDILDGLFHIARADGRVTEEEENFLRQVSDIFGFSNREYRRIRASRLGREPDDPYLILGIDESIQDEDIKKAYRRMASANHPDRIMARGLPAEMQGLASKKMAMINLAYEKIVAERGLAA
jgi:DnaJ like chaperone protein